jgi:hypothetical protein
LGTFALDLRETLQFSAGKVVVATFAMRAAAQGHWERLEDLGVRLAADPAMALLAPIVVVTPGNLETLLRSDHTLTSALAVLFGTDAMPEENLLLAASVRVWEWVRRTPFIEVVGAPIGQAVAAHWRRRLETGGFALRNPRLHGPDILAAAVRVEDSPALAKLLLAVEPTVRLNLPTEMIAALREAAGNG